MTMRNYYFAAPLLAALFGSAPAFAEPIICPDIPAAEEGSASDQYFVGKAYDEGYCGIAADKKEAEHWYRTAAEHGHALAQYELAETYFTGDGVAVDYPEAKKWYQQAASHGHGLSQLRLGFLNAEAHFPGLTTNYTEAENWFAKAAEQNAGDARFRLGNFYNNYKQPPDFEKGYYWLKLAAEGGHRVAMFDLARVLLEGKGTAINIKDGVAWMTKAAEADILQAQMSLAEMYAIGKYTAKNPAESLKWTLRIANKPTASVFYLAMAGDLFFEGKEGVPRNYPTARKYYERAAEKGDAHALEQLARMYEEGLGVGKSPARATEYRKKATALK